MARRSLSEAWLSIGIACFILTALTWRYLPNLPAPVAGFRAWRWLAPVRSAVSPSSSGLLRSRRWIRPTFSLLGGLYSSRFAPRVGISAGQARSYHEKEFANAEQNYYSQKGAVQCEWTGKLATEMDLKGAIAATEFERLAEGRHPSTGEQLVEHRVSRTYKNERGETVTTAEDRAGWDATSARPVNGYAALQLHTHVVIFNVSRTADSETHALQPHELYKSQQYATSVYQSELAARLRGLGYDLEPAKNGTFEIKDYTPEYLQASSLRRQQMKLYLEAHGCRVL